MNRTNWVPGITFSTPGDLRVTYAVQRGLCFRDDHFVVLTFEIQTATFTHSTASGQLIISGIPFNCSAAQFRYVGTLHQQGLSKSGGSHSQWNLMIHSGGIGLNFYMSGSGVGEQLVQIAQVPTMVNQSYVGSITYEAEHRGGHHKD